MKTKHLSKIILSLLLTSVFATGCNSITTSTSSSSTDERYQIYQLAVADGYTGTYQEWLASIKGQDGQTPYIGENGNWWIGNTDTGVKATGKDGKDGSNGRDGIDGRDGRDGREGKDGKDGDNGRDGQTPYIGDNGNWWIGDTDTGVKAAGTDGKDGSDGSNGSDGKDGENGLTPYIGENGNWWIGNTDTGVKAAGTDGRDGSDGSNGRDGIDGSDGKDGSDGENGKSAYELYCEAHPEYQGNEDEWLSDLINGRLGNKEVHTVTFDSQGGSQVSSQNVQHGEKASKPTNPTKDGYNFVEWVDENNDHWVFNGYSITSDITLYAVWEAAEYTITLNPNGGEVSKTSIDVIYGSTFELPTPTKEGYTFDGWYLNDEEITSGQYTFNHDISLVAHWGPLFIIHFDTNGGSEIEDYNGYINYTVSSLPTPTKDGNQFLGWYYNDSLVEAPFTYSYESFEVTFVAKWKEVSGDYLLQTLSDNQVMIIGYTGSDTELVIPSTMNGKTVRSISNEVFKENNAITKIILPNTITAIGNEAFANMASLEEIVLSDNLVNVGDNILLGCNNLKKITMTASSIMILDFFDYDEKNIPNNLILTLRYNSNSYIIPTSGIFKNLRGTVKFNIIFDNSWDTLYRNIFKGCKNVLSVIISEGITSIGNDAFYYCSSLTSIVIPNGVTSIGDETFRGCSSLTSIVIPESVASIGNYAFYNCSSLTSIAIPDGVASIGDYVFADCTSLTSIVIPSSVTSIGSNAFDYCYSLSSIVIPNSVTSIGNDAFNRCTSLKHIFYAGSKSQWNKISIGTNNDYLLNTSIEYNSPVTQLNTISTNKYSYLLTNDNRVLEFRIINQSITTFNFADELPGLTIITIEDRAFFNCSSLTSIVIPESVTSIGNYAFFNCSSLTSIVIPESVTSIGNYAFRNCSSLTSIVIPDSVTSIGDYVFADCTSLTSMVIPNSVTSIGAGAFYDCTSLTSIVIPDSVTSIGDYVFADCTSLTSIVIPEGVTSIEERAFFNCSSLTSIVIPESVASIGNSAFYDCTSLTSIVIPDSVTSIQYYAFAHCSSLTSIVIPNSITSIGNDVFNRCTSLTSIVIPNSVTSIGNDAFEDCSSLTSIVIPDSVTSIGDYVFADCTSLSSITFEGTIEQWTQISKGSVWNYDIRAKVVHCSDGDVDI